MVAATTLFGADIAIKARRGDWAGAVHEAYALGLISDDDIEHAFDTGADVIAHLTAGAAHRCAACGLTTDDLTTADEDDLTSGAQQGEPVCRSWRECDMRRRER